MRLTSQVLTAALFASHTFSCGADPADAKRKSTPEEFCPTRSNDACEQDADCVVEHASPYDLKFECWRKQEPIGCFPTEMLRSGAIVCWFDERGMRWMYGATNEKPPRPGWRIAGCLVSEHCEKE